MTAPSHTMSCPGARKSMAVPDTPFSDYSIDQYECHIRSGAEVLGVRSCNDEDERKTRDGNCLENNCLFCAHVVTEQLLCSVTALIYCKSITSVPGPSLYCRHVEQMSVCNPPNKCNATFLLLISQWFKDILLVNTKGLGMVKLRRKPYPTYMHTFTLTNTHTNK